MVWDCLPKTPKDGTADEIPIPGVTCRCRGADNRRSQAVSATPDTGNAAPVFSVTDSAGKPFSLANFKGKTVVWEWTNHDCPYVRKHCIGGNMQDIQRDATKDGVVWLQVILSAPGL